VAAIRATAGPGKLRTMVFALSANGKSTKSTTQRHDRRAPVTQSAVASRTAWPTLTIAAHARTKQILSHRDLLQWCRG
jgi:hypothetical protein